MLIAPADVGADGVVLLGVATVVGAVEREVAQGGDRVRGRYLVGYCINERYRSAQIRRL